MSNIMSNNLPTEVVGAHKINSFKIQLEKHWIIQAARYHSDSGMSYAGGFKSVIFKVMIELSTQILMKIVDF